MTRLTATPNWKVLGLREPDRTVPEHREWLWAKPTSRKSVAGVLQARADGAFVVRNALGRVYFDAIEPAAEYLKRKGCGVGPTEEQE